MKAGDTVLWKNGYVDGSDRKVQIKAIFKVEDSIHSEDIGLKLYLVNIGSRDIKLTDDELEPMK